MKTLNIVNIMHLRCTNNIKNRKIKRAIKWNTDEVEINSKDFIRVVFSECFFDDLMFLIKLKKRDSLYKYIVLRAIVEQTILFAYLMSNEEKIQEYLGLNIDLDEVLDSARSNYDEIDLLKTLGEKRYKKMKVNKMSEIIDGNDIESKENSEGNLKIYQIYRLLSDYIHDAYFKQISSRTESKSNTFRKNHLEEDNYEMYLNDTFSYFVEILLKY